MKVTFLGTSGSMPTPERGSSSIAVQLSKEVILLDCGEGTQRQMITAHIGFARVSKILVSHMHGDHVLGIPGLLQTMTLQGREKELELYGPKGLHGFLKAVSDSLGGPSFPAKVNELTEPGVIIETPLYTIKTCKAQHGINSWSYSIEGKPKPGRFYPAKVRSLGVPEGNLWKKLQEGEDILFNGKLIKSVEVVDAARPGIKIAYSGDTLPNNDLIELAKNADLLIHEATFSTELQERATKDQHSTSVQAAEVAHNASVKRLILTHISARYNDTIPLLEDARRIFPATDIAIDLLNFVLSSA